MATITYNEIKAAVYAWIDSILNDVPDSYFIVYANQNFPKLKDKPIITILINSMIKVGQDYVTSPDEVSGLATISGDREFTVQLQSFGPKLQTDAASPRGIEGLIKIRDSLYNPVILQALRDSNLSYINVISGITDISGLDQTEFEERGSFDIKLRYGLQDDPTIDVGVIEEVQADGSYEPFCDPNNPIERSLDTAEQGPNPIPISDFCPIGQNFISSPPFDASDYSLRNAVVIGDTVDYQDLGEGPTSFVVIPVDSSPSNRRNVKFHTKFRTKPFSVSNFQKAGFGSSLGSARVGLLTVPVPDNRILFSFNDTFITDTVLLSGINDTDVFDIELTIIVDDTTIHSFGKILDINGVEVASFDETEPGMLLPTRNDPFVAASFNSELPTVKEFFYSGINYPGEPCTGA